MNPATTVPTRQEAVRFNTTERRAVTALAGLYAARMLGLFLLLPVLALYARHLPGATPGLVGLAMGAYGLSQVLLQIPFGRWSDRYGRRPMIALGLVLFLLGSVIGACATTMWTVILARAVQGAGSISAVVTALLADATREQVRTRAMALIGISIGASFVISLVAAPLLEAHIGVPGIFWMMAGMALLGLLSLRSVPTVATPLDPGTVRMPTWAVAVLPALRQYFVGVFALHFILQATFLVVPLLLLDQLGIPKAQHSQVYLGVFVLSLVGTYALLRSSEHAARPQTIYTAAIVTAMIGQVGMALSAGHFFWLAGAFTVFFAAFNFLEARLPAALSRVAPATERGAALGVFATCQFLGSAVGGLAGGQLLHFFGLTGVLWGCVLLALLWAGVSVAQPE